jgi:membrane dipeptidase
MTDIMPLSALLADSIVWDNHTCMPLRLDAEVFLPQLERHRQAGVNVVCVNVHFGESPWHEAFTTLAVFRRWIAQHADRYRLIDNVGDIDVAKAYGQLGIMFDIEGGRAVEPHPGLVELYYRLGVRWMLLAYNKNNRLGGGCLDEDSGLTAYGRTIIDEMERVGMVLCCSHTGYRTAREALEYAQRPVIFSHSNPRALHDHPRNIPDDLMLRCAASGGVVNLNGFGIFLGDNDNSTDTLIRHIDYVVELIGPEHVGFGLDFVFDSQELDEHIRTRPDVFPPEKGYRAGVAMVEPERIPAIAAGLLRRGYSEAQVQGILGNNNLRVARQVWKPS